MYFTSTGANWHWESFLTRWVDVVVFLTWMMLKKSVRLKPNLVQTFSLAIWWLHARDRLDLEAVNKIFIFHTCRYNFFPFLNLYRPRVTPMQTLTLLFWVCSRAQNSILVDVDYISTSMYLICSPDLSQVVSTANPKVQEPLSSYFYARQDILLVVLLYFLYAITSHTNKHGE